MNLHEYQSKELLALHNVPIQRGIAVESVEDALKAGEKLTADTGTKFWVVKAQVHAGGRGKGGGVKLAKSMDELKQVSSDILGMTLVTPQTGAEGKHVNTILVAEDMFYPGEEEIEEFYLSFLLDRAKHQHVVMYSPEGGMDIEEVAEHKPDKIFKEWINPATGIMPFQARKIAYNLGLKGAAFKDMTKFIGKLYNAYLKLDATMLEINPLLKTSDSKMIVVDAKVDIDDNALFRHKDIAALRDEREEDPTEVKAKKHHLNYVNLDGNVGCMVNGAGLAMATMDIIKLSGGEPANFLDVGGTANAQTVEAGFRIIMEDPKVEAILVNIFGGIVRCDRVAQGVVDAYKNIGEINIPIIVRLQGTNAEEAKVIIDESGLKVHSAIILKEAAEKVAEVLAK